jgi:hypothetical protein
VYNQNASQGQSQYRGMQTSFQPTGFVNSVYGGQGQIGNYAGNQQQGQMGVSQNQMSNPQSQFGSQPYGMGSQSYGNQQFGGQQGQMGMSSNQFGGQSQFGRSPMGMSANNFTGTTPDSPNYGAPEPSGVSQPYHMNNYRGNTQGHDYYLRADSTIPAQQQQGQFGMSSNQFGGQQGQFGSQQGQFGGQQGQFGSTGVFGRSV